MTAVVPPQVFCVLASVPAHFGGLTRSVFERSSMLVDQGIPVTLLVRNYRRETHESLAAAQARGLLDPRVDAFCHWEMAAPSGDGGAVAGPVDLESLDGIEHLGRGKPDVRLDEQGRIRQIRHAGPGGRVVCIEDHDTRGRVVQVMLQDSETGIPTRTHFLDNDGTPWMSLAINPINRLPGRGKVKVDGTFVQVSSRSAAQTPWVNAMLALHENPVLFVDSRTGDHVAIPVRVPQVRLIAVGHNNHSRVPANVAAPYRDSWRRLISYAHHFDAVVLLSDEQLQDFAGIVRPGTELRVIPHPAHVPPEPSSPVERSDRTLVCLARFEPQKRLEHAIEAWALVVRSVPDAQLDLYGSGPLEEKMRGLVAERGLQDNVTFKGYTSDPDGALRGAAALLMSSAFEGLPLVLFESLAVGTPVVSYDLKYGPRMVVRDGVDGLLATDGDVEALAAAVVRLLTDDELRASMVRRAPEVLERFPRSAWSRQWVDLVHEVGQLPRRDRTLPPHKVPGQIGVSVIVPVLNEESHLEAAVKSILSQKYPGPREVILALGPSSDGTDAVAEKLATDPRVHLVRNPSGSTPAALNVALEASRHGVVVRVDGHTVLRPGYLAKAVGTLERTGAAKVGGIMRPEGTNPFERSIATAMRSELALGGPQFPSGGEGRPADTVYLGAMTREAVEQLGGYDERFHCGQDWELDQRIRESGGQIWFDPGVMVTYRPRATLTALARQYRDHGRWWRTLRRLHPAATGPRTVATPLSVLAVPAGLVVAAVGAVIGAPWLLLGLLLPIAYLVGVGFAALASGRSRREKAWLLAVFPTMHLSWAWGYLTSPRRLARPA